MDKKIKRQWVKALKSGEYTQGNGCLKEVAHKKKAKYCCLGVLCDLHAKANKKKWTIDEYGQRTYFDHFNYPGKEVIEWASLPNENPDMPSARGKSLAGLNDEGKTFKEIAKLIEADL